MKDNVDTDSLDGVLWISRSNPYKALTICNNFIEKHQNSRRAYGIRHHIYESMGRYHDALADCEKSLQLDPSNKGCYFDRGEIFRLLGEYEAAIRDFDMAFKLDVEGWFGSLGRLSRADCHARLGNREQALADCAKLDDEHWTPGMCGLPRGNRAEVTAEIERILSTVKRKPEKH